MGIATIAAETAAQTVNAADIQPLLTEITSVLTLSNLMTYISVGIGASVGLVLFWFGIRKLKNMVMSAFKRGKLSV